MILEDYELEENPEMFEIVDEEELDEENPEDEALEDEETETEEDATEETLEGELSEEGTPEEGTEAELTDAETLPEGAETVYEDVDELDPNRKVTISATTGTAVNFGDVVTLYATFSGYDGVDVDIQWQYNDGSGWTDAPGATDQKYSFVIDESNYTYAWRLNVTPIINEEPVETAEGNNE